MEKQAPVFFVARRIVDNNESKFIEIYEASSSSNVLVNKIEASTLAEFLEQCRSKLGMIAPQARADDGSPIASESIFNEFKTFHLVDMNDTTVPVEPTGPLTTSVSELLLAGPTPYPIVGNLPHLIRSVPLQTDEMFKKYGPIIRLQIFNSRIYFTDDARVVKAIYDNPDVFPKVVEAGPLWELRRLAGDGLFTANDWEENWGIAHRILMPAFGRASIQKYAPEISRSARKFIDNMTRIYGSENDIPLLNWTTKMTFDAIATCGFAYDFNSLDQEEEAPAITWMVDILTESLARSQRGAIGNWVNIWADRRYSNNISNFHKLVEEILEKRRHEPEDVRATRQDLLSLMLTSADPQTGKKLSDLNMIYQCVTFLIAGHETTSTLLSWACYLISQHPSVEQKLLEEIDSILSADPSVPPTMQQVSQLKYLDWIIKETLRLYPPVPALAKGLTKQFAFEFADPENPGQTKRGLTDPSCNRIAINAYSLHRNKVYWGEDAEKFIPERWSPEAVSERSQKNGSANAFTWMPFSFGPRGCIGMQFALLEAKIVLSMLYRQYIMRVSNDSKVTMQTAPSLTLRPEHLFVRMHPRIPKRPAELPAHVVAPVSQPQETDTISSSIAAELNLLVLFGSNTGSSEDIGLKLAHTAETALRGTKIVSFTSLDQAVPLLEKHNGPKDAVLVVTATYNGQPPDNAGRFSKWLDETRRANPHVLKGVKFAVMGVGNSQWVTFQAFPRKVDNALEALGAERYMGRGELDMDASNWEDAFLTWRSGWIAQLIHTFVGKDVNASAALQLSASIATPSNFSVTNVDEPEQTNICPVPGANKWKILSKRELQTRESDRRTVHLELELPAGVKYSAGDHLAVCPRNNVLLVQALAARLKLNLNQYVVLSSTRPQSTSGVALPFGSPISIKDILTYFVDITSSPSMSSIAVLAENASDPAQKAALKRLAGTAPDEYKKSVTSQWKTILELLIEFSSVDVSFDRMLDVLPRMQPRFYSISSSPLECPKSLSITVGVSQTVSPAGRVVDGVCSTFLGSVDPTLDHLVAYVRDLNNKSTPFRLPESPTTPLLLISAGTGFAPFRGFLQERRALKQHAGAQLGKAIVVFGCRHPKHDYIYADELAQLEADGALTSLHVAFSRKSATCKEYCQDILLQHGEEVWRLISEEHGRVYICGSAGGLARGVRAALVKIVGQHGNRSDELAERFVSALEETGSLLQDVWG